MIQSRYLELINSPEEMEWHSGCLHAYLACENTSRSAALTAHLEERWL